MVGGILRSLLWRRSGDIGRSTETAASVGRGFGYLMIFLGALEFVGGAPAGLWLSLIGFFGRWPPGGIAVGVVADAKLATSPGAPRRARSKPDLFVAPRAE